MDPSDRIKTESTMSPICSESKAPSHQPLGLVGIGANPAKVKKHQQILAPPKVETLTKTTRQHMSSKRNTLWRSSIQRWKKRPFGSSSGRSLAAESSWNASMKKSSSSPMAATSAGMFPSAASITAFRPSGSGANFGWAPWRVSMAYGELEFAEGTP